MATDLANLTTAKANLTATLASITANPKPTYSIDGRSYSWTEYQRFLLDAIENLRLQIIAESGPFIIRSRGI